MKIRPLHDRVLVRPLEEAKTSAGGIIIPDSANTEKPNSGEIIAAGNGRITDSGDVRAMDVKIGDNVLFGQYAGTAVKMEGEDLLMMKEEDILAVLEG
jgi:chaperonin GroES